MDCRHKIVLKGFENNIFTHNQIVLLAGCVESPCSQDHVEINGVHIYLWNKSFKYLMRLENESEHVKLSYCNCQLNVIIQHITVEPVVFDVLPLYIVCNEHDGSFQTTSDDSHNTINDAVKKIDLCLELVQCVMSSKFVENGLESRSFSLQKCQVFNSELNVNQAWAMDQWELYDYIAKELVTRIGRKILKARRIVGFMSCTKFKGMTDNEDFSYNNIKSKTVTNPALSGNFLCLLGSGTLYCWPNRIEEVAQCFQNKRKIDVTQVLDDSNYRRTYGGCYSTSLGSVIHEIGHIFDLAHTERGLMGNDIDYVHRFFSNENVTEILPKRNVRCQLVGSVKGLLNTADPRFTKLKKSGNFLEKYREQKNNDMTFFEENCLITLFYHKWFSQSLNIQSSIIFMDERTIMSIGSELKLVEIRELHIKNSLLIKFWKFESNCVAQFDIPSFVKLENVALFAINSNGDILNRQF